MIDRIRNHQLIHLLLAHARELIREPGVLFWGIGFPILMSLGLGVAFMQKKEVTREVALVADTSAGRRTDSADRFPASLLLSGKLRTDRDADGHPVLKRVEEDSVLGNSVFLFRVMPWKEAITALKRGNLNLILMEQDGKPVYHFDPRNPDAQLAYLKLSAMDLVSGTSIRETPDDIRPLTVTGTRYIDFLIPGLIALGVMMSTLWGVSYGIIERRSKKLLRRMVATPMRRSNFLIALMSVRILMNFAEAGLLLLFAWIVFGISVQGSIPALLLLFVSGNFVFTGIAVLAASRTAKTEIGNGLINAISMPMMVLSGIFFSYQNFPGWSIPVIRALPLTRLADGLRSVMIEGAGLQETGWTIILFFAAGSILFTAGLRLFRWH